MIFPFQIPINQSFTLNFELLSSPNSNPFTISSFYKSYISQNGGAWVQNTNTATFIDSPLSSTNTMSGTLVLTAAETNANVIQILFMNVSLQMWQFYTIYTSGTSFYAPGLSSSTTLAELTAIPSANDTLANKIQAIFQYLFFKRTVTASQEQLYKSDQATVIGTGATLSDNGTTFTKGAES